jgi:DNA-binding SARP family transcriptional activator
MSFCAASQAPEPDDLIEVRLLGPLQVRRRDGSLVEDREWRTGKTADLLRLLALGDGKPVVIDRLLEELWPDVDYSRGRASLRTAASQLRAVLGREAIDRRPAGLVLDGAWVDVVAYERLAGDAQRLLREGARAPGVRAAREAEALRLGDLTAHETGARWVFEARAAHQTTRLQLLLAVSEAALALGWLADATELAASALEQDPTNEQATRSLMQGYARLGASSAALREFDRCRRLLADELGVDPSPQTQALHLELLSGRVPEHPAAPVPGPRREAAQLLTLLADARRTGTSLTVDVTGDTAPERLHVVSAVCGNAGARLLVAPDVASGLARTTRRRPTEPGVPCTDVVFVEYAASWPAPAAADLPAHVVLVLGADEPRDVPAGAAVELQVLLREELLDLAEEVLGNRPSTALLAELAEVAGGSEARAVIALQRWMREGRVRTSGMGMVLVDEPALADRATTRTALARTIERLSALDLEVLATLAVLDRPASVDQFVPVLAGESPGARDHAGTDRTGLETSLGHLVDLGLLRRLEGRLVLRDALLTDAVRSWLRPSVLSRLHRSVAERALVTSAERIEHWLAAGEPALACAAALEAADTAFRDGRPEDARTHLLQVCSLADVQVDVSGDGADLSEQLADALRQLGRPKDAERARLYAADPAPTSVRQLPSAVLGTRAALSEPPPPPEHRHSPHPALPRLLAAAPERRGSLQHSHLPAAALPLLVRSDSPVPTLAGPLVEVLAGNAVHAERALVQLRASQPPDADPSALACIDLLLRVAAHDLGHDGNGPSWREMVALAQRAGPDWAWAPVRVLTERHDLVGAAAADAGATTGGRSDLGGQLQLLARAVLRSTEGDRAAAIASLSALVDGGVRSGCTLLLPEAAARLAMEEARQGSSAALEHFDLFEWTIGAQDARPRASTLRLLARAALRSGGGDHRRAAAAAAQAAHVAHASRLVPLAAHAQLDRARYLAADGSSEAVTAMALARDAFRVAGIESPFHVAVPVEEPPPRPGRAVVGGPHRASNGLPGHSAHAMQTR